MECLTNRTVAMVIELSACYFGNQGNRGMGPPVTEVMKIQLEPLQKPSSMICPRLKRLPLGLQKKYAPTPGSVVPHDIERELLKDHSSGMK